MGILANMLYDNLFKPQDVPGFENKLFFEGARRRPYLEQFGALLVLSVIIATMGVLGDSTATVIGAMIIAPLMTPILATAAALVMGQTVRAAQSMVIVVVGVAAAIGLSWLLGTLHLATGVISFDANSQIVARTSPQLIDLIAALAAGAAGAFATSRDDVADSLAGVAISISLVPPLCVVGIGLAAGEWAAAWGAFLLFITNFLSILLAGGGVLALLGLSRAATVEIRGTARRNAFIAIGVGVLLVMVPLSATSFRIAQQALIQGQTKAVVQAWIQGTDYDVRVIRVVGNQVDILITGPGEPPPTAELVANLEAALQQPIEVNLEIIPSNKQELSIK